MLFRGYTVDLDFKKNLDKVMKTNIRFNEKDRNSSVISCNLILDNKRINLNDCTVCADITLDASDYENAKEIKTTIMDAEKGIVAFKLPQELMVAGVKHMQVHVNHKEQVLHSPIIEFEIYAGL